MSDRAPESLRSWNPDRGHRVCAAAVLTVVAVISTMGCLNMSFGGKSTTSDDPGVLSQTNKIAIPKGQMVDVYYPVPYGSPPNLVLDDSMHVYEIVEQKADHFRVRNNSMANAVPVTWTASGMRAAAPATTPTTTTTQVTTVSTQP